MGPSTLMSGRSRLTISTASETFWTCAGGGGGHIRGEAPQLQTTLTTAAEKYCYNGQASSKQYDQMVRPL